MSYGLTRRSSQGFHRSAVYDDPSRRSPSSFSHDATGGLFLMAARWCGGRGLCSATTPPNDWPGEATTIAPGPGRAVSWVGYALAFYLAHRPPCAGDRGCERRWPSSLRTAVRLGEYLSRSRSTMLKIRGRTRWAGLRQIELAYKPGVIRCQIYTAGPTGHQTENNIAPGFLCAGLGAVTGDARWRPRAERVRTGLLKSAWDPSIDQFIAGFIETALPTPQKPWTAFLRSALLAAAGDPGKGPPVAGVVDSRYASRDGKSAGFRPYSDSPYTRIPRSADFLPDNPRPGWPDLPLVWSEGTWNGLAT